MPNEERIVRRKLSELRPGKTDWERLRNMTDEEIEEAARSDPDNPPLDEEFFRTAKRITPPRKETIQLNVDEDVLEWFKNQGKDYKARMSAVLREYVDEQNTENS